MRAPTWLPAPARRVPRLTRRLWHTTAGHLARIAGRGRRAWRRSLQLRVVTITLVASSLLVGAFGGLVASRSADILLSRAEDGVQARLNSKVLYAREQLTVHRNVFDAKLPTTMTNIVLYLSGGEAAQSGGAVVSLRGERYQGLKAVMVPSIDSSAVITGDMVSAVSGRGQVAMQIRTADIGQGRQVFLVCGSPVSTRFGQLELYYVVPIDTEVRAANQIRATVLATGLALVLLLGLVAGLVTRLVVSPVRIAARTAQRLSAGLLDQRMKVDGEDDLALLAAAFNQMAENLQRQIVRLEEMSRLQRRLTSDVSHELRTPLTTVRMAADLIFAERDAFEPAVARSAELLQAELDRFEDLLTDLLEISRFDAGFAILDAEPTDLVPIVHRAVEGLAGVAERCGVRVELNLPESAIAELDPRRVERVLRNLLGNAIEHGEGRPVEVTMADDDAAVAITVRDSGVGLKPGEEKLVFNRFWRADPSRARQTGGTGLGLSISLEDARLHGGWLEAWGRPGEGAHFRLTLPVRSGDRLISSPLPLVPPGAQPEGADRSGPTGEGREPAAPADAGSGTTRADDADAGGADRDGADPGRADRDGSGSQSADDAGERQLGTEAATAGDGRGGGSTDGTAGDGERAGVAL
jgi:two-component system sensor histidine kinase MtrB